MSILSVDLAKLSPAIQDKVLDSLFSLLSFEKGSIEQFLEDCKKTDGVSIELNMHPKIDGEARKEMEGWLVGVIEARQAVRDLQVKK